MRRRWKACVCVCACVCATLTQISLPTTYGHMAPHTSRMMVCMAQLRRVVRMCVGGKRWGGGIDVGVSHRVTCDWRRHQKKHFGIVQGCARAHGVRRLPLIVGGFRIASHLAPISTRKCWSSSRSTILLCVRVVSCSRQQRARTLFVHFWSQNLWGRRVFSRVTRHFVV